MNFLKCVLVHFRIKVEVGAVKLVYIKATTMLAFHSNERTQGKLSII